MLDSVQRLTLRNFLSEKIGIYYADERLEELVVRFKSAAQELGFEDVDKCAKWLLSGHSHREHLGILAKHFTIGETYFFRDPDAFKALSEIILPALLTERRQRQKYLRIWSAGCCTGEEAYSVAMILAELIPDFDDWQIELLATDINDLFLAKAKQGVYREWSFRGVPQRIKDLYFSKTADGGFAIKPRIKKMVNFAYANLMDGFEQSLVLRAQAMDVIFCRNVLIYFSNAQAAQTIENLRNSLVEGGHMILAPSEVGFASENLQLINAPGCAILRNGGSNTTTSRVLESTRPLPNINDLVLKQADADSVSEDEFSLAAIVQRECDALARTLTDNPFVSFDAFEASSALPVEKSTADAETTHQESASKLSIFKQIKSRISGDRQKVDQDSGTKLRIALEAYSIADYKKAAAILIDLSETGKHPALEVLITRCFANQGDFDSALKWADKAIKSDKLNAVSYYLKAMVLQELGKLPQASQCFQQALFVDSNFVLAEFALGNLCRKQSQEQRAIKHFRNALKLLEGYDNDFVLPESEGLTVGSLSTMLSSVISQGK